MSNSNASVGVGQQNDSSKAGTPDGSQKSTGGSGPTDAQASGHRLDPIPAPGERPTANPAEGAGTAVTASNRGAQDTRSRQAGGAGLGSAETGANQTSADVSPRQRD